MRIGIATTDFPATPLDPLFERIGVMGFESVQLSLATIAEVGFAPSGQIEIPGKVDPALLARIRTKAEDCGLAIAALNGTFNMAHPDPAVRAEGIRRFEPLADAANALGCPVITLCSGTREASYLWTAHPDNRTAEAWGDMLTTLRALVRIAESRSIAIAVETEAANVVDTTVKARLMLDEIASPALKMVMDCANLFHAGEAWPENVGPRMREAFTAYGKDVAIAHGKDIRASAGIDYCAIGEGMIDFPLFVELMNEYGLTCDMILHGIDAEKKMTGGLALMRGFAGVR